jgi:hypothetical protein
MKEVSLSGDAEALLLSISQSVMLKRSQTIKQLPDVFTEHVVALWFSLLRIK